MADDPGVVFVAKATNDLVVGAAISNREFDLQSVVEDRGLQGVGIVGHYLGDQLGEPQELGPVEPGALKAWPRPAL